LYLANNEGSALYPTALLFGARTPLRYDPVSRKLELPLDHTLRLIDGQHRREGLRYVIEDRGHDIFKSMQVPVVILETRDKLEEMDQFKTINGTARSVRTDLVNAILTAIAEEQGIEAIPEKDQWKVVVMKIVSQLDARSDSPWHDLLLMPDEIAARTAPGKITRATSMITSIRPLYEWLNKLNFLDGKTTQEAAGFATDILVAYWSAIRNLVPDAFEEPDQYVIQKTPGLFSLHWLLKERLLPDMWHGRRPWDEATFIEFLQESPEICDADFRDRASGQASAFGSMKGFRALAELLKDSVAP
jgi:DGQHR domain-containing protein